MLGLINAFRRGVSSVPWYGLVTDFPLLPQQQRIWTIGGCEDEGSQGLFSNFLFVRGLLYV
jgi:hypothetical protein